MPQQTNPFDDYSHLLQLIDFAVRKEIEAAEFYRALAARLAGRPTAGDVGKLAAMEEEHRARLEKLNVAEAAWKEPLPLEGLRLADYTVEADPKPDMSVADLLRLAVRREVAAMNLYRDLARLVPDSMLKTLLENLAGEEAQHRQYVERLLAEGA